MCNKPTPLISVLMPVYNCGQYLDESIGSIRCQTLEDFEFVIVNDCRRVNESGELGQLWTMPLDHESIVATCLQTGGCGLVQPTLMVRRAALKAVGGYRTFVPFAQDLDLFLRLSRVGRLANLADIHLLYRSRPEQASAPNNVWQSLAVIAVLRDAALSSGSDVRMGLANRYRLASRQATNLGLPLRGIYYGVRALLLTPTRAETWRAFARSVLKARPWPS